MRAALAAELGHLRSRAGDVAWVAPENLHVTVKFLGSVAEERLPAVGRAVGAVAAASRPFSLIVSGLGAFPTVTRPRVVWAGLGPGTEALAALAGQVEEALAALGFAREGRPFVGHVTLGRRRQPRPDAGLARTLVAAAGRRFGRTVVDRLVLMRSDLGPRGARYRPLESWPLGA